MNRWVPLIGSATISFSRRYVTVSQLYARGAHFLYRPEHWLSCYSWFSLDFSIRRRLR